MSDKQKWPRAEAMHVAEKLCLLLVGACTRIVIAGSLRRGRAEVGDVEILYVPRFDEAKLPGEMFAQAEQNLVDLALDNLLLTGVLEKRLNVKGSEMFGEKNKLVRDITSGIPVDLFATTEDCWFNYLVCRTGGSQNNIDICQAAIARGWKWNPYGSGFSRAAQPGQHEGHRETRTVTSEREVFEFVGLPWREPEQRA